MTTENAAQSGDLHPSGEAGPRRGRIARNVATNWLWFGLVMVSGLIIPRFIAHHEGQALLGVWDLGWSMTFYVGLFSLGLTSAVTRFVAHHRARGDRAGLNAVVNTGLILMSAGTVLGIGFSFVLAALAPYAVRDARPEVVTTAWQVILILSIASALQFPGTVLGGVIAGCERYDRLNLVRGSCDGLTLILMIALLVKGGTLVGLAWILLLMEIPSFAARAVVARRLCPELRFAAGCFRWSTAREMVLFSGKASIQALASSALYQLNGILVSSFLGPAVLAVYSRQRVLVFQSMRFIRQYAQVFIPSSSGLHAAGDLAALRRMLVTTSRYGMYFTVPVVIVLLVMGRPLVDLWMRPGYAAPSILSIMALGHLLSVSQQGVYMVLMGMGRHGRPALFDCAAALASLLLAVVLLSLGYGMTGAALAMTLPVTAVGGILMPLYACRILQQDPIGYFREITVGPLVANLPFALCLLAARWASTASPVSGLLVGLLAGGMVNALVYWRWVVPAEFRERVLGRFRRRRADLAHPVAGAGRVAAAEVIEA